MKLSIYLFVLLIFFGCKSVVTQNNPNQIFEAHLKIIEKLLNEETVEKLEPSVKFLEEITGIKSEVDIGVELLSFPTEQNLKDWKSWYKKNKSSLYWDDKEQKVKVKK